MPTKSQGSNKRTVWRTDSADGGDNVRTVTRYDRATLGRVERTAQGYIRVPARIAQPGVMLYRNPDGSTRRELVLPERLFHKDSLATLASCPMTLEHPDEEIVTPENVGKYSVGDVGEKIVVDRIGDFVEVMTVVRRKDALDAVEQGINEVSPGYVCEVDFTPGTHEKYGEYDAIQGIRRYNHLALTKASRGGREIRLQLDSAIQVTPTQTPAPTVDPPKPRTNMHSLIAIAALVGIPHTDSQDKELSEDALSKKILAKIRKDMGDLEAAQAELAKSDMSPEEAAAEIDRLKGVVAALEAKLAEREKVDEEAAEAAEIERMDSLAAQVKFDSSAWTKETTVLQRKVDVAKHLKLLEDEDSPNEARLDGMFQVIAKGTTHGRVDAWAGVGLKTDKPPGPTEGTRKTRVDGGQADKPKVADPFKAAIAKRRADAAAAK